MSSGMVKISVFPPLKVRDFRLDLGKMTHSQTASYPATRNGRRRTVNRNQKSGDRAKSKEQRTEDRGQKPGVRRQNLGDRRQYAVGSRE